MTPSERKRVRFDLHLLQAGFDHLSDCLPGQSQYRAFLQEDDRLKAAVKEFGNERIDWKEVQQKFKLRAAKSCRLRWACLSRKPLLVRQC